MGWERWLLPRRPLSNSGEGSKGKERERSLEEVEFGHTSCGDYGVCFLYSVQPPQLASALAPGGYCPGPDLCGAISLHPQPLLGGGDKAKFPGWQTSNFFTRLKTLGVGGGGWCGL